MNYLAIDAATEACSVALLTNDNVISRFELCPQSHSLVLLPMIDEVLKEAGMSLQQLDGLFYGRGPGSFTGVRIGIGVTQGLAFAADLPTVGISTLQTMAQQAYQEHSVTNVCAAIDARMAEIYTADFQCDEQGLMQLIGEEQVMPPQDFVNSRQLQTALPYGVGTGWQAYLDILSPLKGNDEVPVLFPHAKYMLALGAAQMALGNAQSAEFAQPVYVRDTVSWKKLPGRE